METDKRLSELFDQLINDRTFSLEGVKAISALKEKAENLEETVKDERTRREAETKRSAELQEMLKAANAVKDAWALREASLVSREKGVTALEQAKAVAEAGVSVFRECFGMVFRNLEVRNSTFGQVPRVGAPNAGTYAPDTVPVNETTERVIK